MRWHGTVFLALVLLVTGVYAYLDVISESPDTSWQALFGELRPTPPSEQVRRILSFDPARVTAIRLQHGRLEAQTRRDGAGWSGVARPARVNDFLDDLLDLAEIMALQVPASELTNHGLDPPQGVIELRRENEPPVVLLLGHRNPPATGVYIRVGRGGPVLLTGALVLWEFDKAIKEIAQPASSASTTR